MLKGRTSSSKTGPGSAKQGSWYAYIEASGRRPGQKAVFVSKYMFESKYSDDSIKPWEKTQKCVLLIIDKVFNLFEMK